MDTAQLTKLMELLRLGIISQETYYEAINFQPGINMALMNRMYLARN